MLQRAEFLVNIEMHSLGMRGIQSQALKYESVLVRTLVDVLKLEGNVLLVTV